MATSTRSLVARDDAPSHDDYSYRNLLRGRHSKIVRLISTGSVLEVFSSVFRLK